MKSTPPMRAVSTMARGITRSAFGVSSDRVVMASNPRNDRQRMEAPVSRGLMCICSEKKGRLLATVPSPSPWLTPQAMRPMKTAMMLNCMMTIRLLKFATSLMPRRFRKVMTAARARM